ncbi:hypothetical protein LX15_005403 [Streptoalloteichus tenebrarius]|uniref:Uncharacterized protein n=2 Tax=Streptoalloteichus tenebrarius (strain ATCC 17920 / DSM 40477 / JCM 4838 / CBS 697.72 / NBRC 16177 / NCIMB 11028 / NRRL B-12390 / A12253. 1 / ISP 5477) TaxID=1933 RepID=A0ABT1I1M1_STRSD|nr:hypothetical protein [Streptoalloteichus tenebrarius]BFE99135.1 hypothetical protein GCM10020241_08110 [Streptoalloteichus tenebrarius]
MAALVAEFDAYLGRGRADLASDLVGYRQHAVWSSREELLQMISELRAVIAPRLTHRATEDRARYLLSPIPFPAEEPAADSD